jgi:hypothetical protein
MQTITVESDGHQIGDIVFIEVLGRPAAAIVLAIQAGHMLIEYELDNYSALRVVPVNNPDTEEYRNVSYTTCPRYWLEAVVANGMSWVGWPHGADHPVPQADVLLSWLDDEHPDRGPTE